MLFFDCDNGTTVATYDACRQGTAFWRKYASASNRVAEWRLALFIPDGVALGRDSAMYAYLEHGRRVQLVVELNTDRGWPESCVAIPPNTASAEAYDRMYAEITPILHAQGRYPAE
jgi:hypothetical protein